MFKLSLSALLLSLSLLACGGGQSPAGTSPAEPGAGAPGNPNDQADGAMVQSAPFRLCISADVCSAEAPAAATVPQPYSYSEGPRPVVNPGTAAAFPAFGWVVGETNNEVIPTFIWQGNRLSGNDSGTLYQVLSVASSQAVNGGTEYQLNTNYNGGLATLTVRTLASGVVEAKLLPPPGMAEEGIAVTLFTIDSPVDEGLFGMGARKDFFNQRGKLRNVWTEQQNTGVGSIADLSFTGAGAPPVLPTGSFADTGLNQDVDDAALAEERTSFPNGAQAAYWVEAFVVGSRGWAAWTADKYFQRIDLAATDSEKIRWQVVDSDTVTLLFADGGDGGIEQASRLYTDYWGRAPAPTPRAWEPWIDTLNQGEGEAAPNGQGFWGGQRARCEVEGFIAKSASTGFDIPFSLIGIEGWHVIPQTHPNCTVQTTAEICASAYPTNTEELQAEIAAGTSFLNAQQSCADSDKSFFDYVEEQGFNIAGYWNFFHTRQGCTAPADCESTDPGVPLESAEAYADAYQRDIYIKAADPNADTTDDNGNHTVTTNRGGVSSLIDFTNDAAVPFWQGQLSRMLNQGISIFMHDFGELTTDDMLFAEGENLQESHNLFAFKYQQAARQSLDNYKAENNLGDDFAPYFYARAGMTGSCSFTPGVFPGDESTSWDAGHGLPSVIPTMLNLSLSGCYAFTTDIGGYFDFTTPRTTEDLFIRWSQLAALTPVMRIHSSTFNGSVFPWTWSDGEDLADEDNAQWDTVGIFRRYAKLKVNLIPLTTHWVDRAAANGDIGPVRPMILDDLSVAAQNADYQWLYGENLLVAAVYEEDQSSLPIYFPAGSRWQQVVVNSEGRLAATGEVFDGGQSVDMVIDNATLADIPLFLRCGSNQPLLPQATPGVVACD